MLLGIVLHQLGVGVNLLNNFHGGPSRVNLSYTTIFAQYENKFGSVIS
jgi:hypothetical protein